MSEHDSVRRLRWHAGSDADVVKAVARPIWECIAAVDPARAGLAAAEEDFVDALAGFNGQLNGPDPSGPGVPPAAIPRDAAFAVAEVTYMFREHLDRLPAGERDPDVWHAVWTIETAWLAVLAGDTDDLRQHLADEWAMRS